MQRALSVQFLLLVTLAAGCQSIKPPPKDKKSAKPVAAATTAAAKKATGPKIIPGKPGPVAPQVKRALAQAKKDGDRLLVYVGAEWCEPCRRFKHAVESGALAGVFPHLRLLAFDADRDDKALASAGYKTTYIPALIVPGPDGRATPKHIEGSIKGPGAVNNIVPRLRALLRR